MPRIHVFIIDGTMSRLNSGEETNAGLLYKLLHEVPQVSVGYDPGIQGKGIMKWGHVITGHGINCSIRYGYAILARDYRPGDKIFLFGFSRGAYAVRSIAGMISRVGLLRPEHSSPKRINKAFRVYENCTDGKRSGRFRRKFSHDSTEIEMIGVWDTVKALGLHFPLISRFAPMATEFHDHRLSPIIKNAFQALAADENRRAFAPVRWLYRPDWPGRLEQAWFAGGHSDVGGHIYELPAARKGSNISLNWMLSRAAMCGLPLPKDWQSRYPEDPLAPMLGPYAGINKFFLFRNARRFGAPQVEYLHESLIERMQQFPRYRPRLKGYPVSHQAGSSLREIPSG